MKRALSRAIAAVLCITFVFSLLPTTALAQLGAITHHSDSITHKRVTVKYQAAGYYANSTPAGDYLIMYNDYLCFILRPNGSTTTVPTRLYEQYLAQISVSSYEDTYGSIMKMFPVTELYSHEYYYHTGSYVTYHYESPSYITASPNTGADADSITALYSLGNGAVMAEFTYSLVQVDNGTVNGITEMLVSADSDDLGRGWGIQLATEYNYQQEHWHFPDDDFNFMEMGVPIQLKITHLGFAKQTDATGGGLLQLAYAKYIPRTLTEPARYSHYSKAFTRTNMPCFSVYAYEDEYNYDTVSEAFTSSFTTDNSFVAVGPLYAASIIVGAVTAGVEGHFEADDPNLGGMYADNCSYQASGCYNNFNGSSTYRASEFTTYSNGNFRAKWEEPVRFDALWGFRDLFTSGDDIPDDSEFEWTNPEGNNYLGIVKNGAEILSVPSENTETLKAAYGDRLVAVLRGLFAQDKDTGEYVFMNGQAALSPTVAASWNSQTGYLKVSEHGVVSSKGVKLSCPSFCFFWAKAENGLDFDFTDGFEINIDPKKNGAFFYINIPGARSEVKKAIIEVDGNLSFTGEMSITTQLLNVADISLSGISMGYDQNNNYCVNGIEGSGSVSMEGILGATTSNVSADINTMNGNFKFGFALELDIPNLFEVSAELKLARLNNGALAPDAIQIGVGGLSVPLTLPAPVARLTGLSGGFSGLAATINGGSSVPPLMLNLGASAEVLGAVEGSASITAGAGYYALRLYDPTLFDFVTLDAEYSQSARISATRRTYRGITYSGIFVDADANAEIHLPNASVDLVTVNGGIAIDVFGGTNGDRLHLDLDAGSSVKGTVKFPKKIGSLKMPGKLAGLKLASSELSVALSLTTVTSFSPKNLEAAGWAKIKSATGSATITYKKKLLDIFTVYIVVSTGSKNVKIGIDSFLGNLSGTFPFGCVNAKKVSGGNDYAIYVVDNTQFLGSTDKVKSVIGDTALLAKNGIVMTENAGQNESSYDVTLSDSALNGQLIFTMSLKDYDANMTDDEQEAMLESLFTVKKSDGTAVDLRFEHYDADGNETTINANAYTVLGGIDNDTDDTVYPAVAVKLPDNGETYTISAKNAASEMVPFDIECVGCMLPEDISSTGEMTELKPTAEYALRAYLTDANGEYYDAEDELTLTSDDNGSTVVSMLPIAANVEYNSLPSGEYTLVYRLFSKINAVDGDGNIAYDEFGDEIFYYVTLCEYNSKATVTNVNPDQLPDPTNVTFTATGNEVLHADWAKPASLKATEFVGYLVTVEQLVGGDWTDTGVSYEVKTDEFGTVATGIDMAITAGGDSNALTANNTYRVKVSVMSDIDVNTGTETKKMRSISLGTISNGAYLAEANPPTLTYSPTPDSADSGAKTVFLRTDGTLNVTATAQGDRTIESINVTNNGLPLTVSAEGCIAIPEFEGALTLYVEATDSAGDMATDYITILKDDIAPVITLDADSIITNADGTFEISGITEPNATVKSEFGEVTVTADGTFTCAGQLYLDSSTGLLMTVTATDKAGNSSSDTVSVGTKLQTPIISPVSGTYDAEQTVSMICANLDAAIYYTTDGTVPTENSMLYTEPFCVRSDMTITAIAFASGMEPSDVATVDLAFKNFTVKFVDWDGRLLKTEYLFPHESATAPANPVREGYTFSGWNQEFSDVTSNLTVMAVYIINRYTVSYYVDGELYGTDSYKFGATIMPLPEPTREGYTFSGWSDIPETMPAENVRVDGAFAINAYTVTFVDGHTGEVITTATVNHGANATFPTPLEHEGYHFTAWDNDGTDITADMTITAQYEINVYTVTFVDGHTSETISTASVEHGKDATLPTPPEHEGYHFTAWTHDGKSITEDTTITAQYAIITFTVKFVDWDGTVLDTQTVDYGKDAKAPTDPTRVGYTFTGWGNAFTSITANLTVTAQYTINEYTVTFVDGLTGETISSATVEYGADAEMPTPPTHEGYSFTGWDNKGKNITADTTITAQYEQIFVLGDVNGDGELNTGDAAIILRQNVELVTFTAEQEKLADYNDDGEINTGDAVAILMYCVGLNNSKNAPVIREER